MLKNGIKITAGENGARACSLSTWFDVIGPLFENRIWAVYNYESMPFRLCDKDAAAYGRLLLGAFRGRESEEAVLLYGGDALALYAACWVPDWLKLAGIDADDRALFVEMLERCGYDGKKYEKWLLKHSDPFIVNVDGWEWRIYSEDYELIHECLAQATDLSLQPITLSFENGYAW